MAADDADLDDDDVDEDFWWCWLRTWHSSNSNNLIYFCNNELSQSVKRDEVLLWDTVDNNGKTVTSSTKRHLADILMVPFTKSRVHQ